MSRYLKTFINHKGQDGRKLLTSVDNAASTKYQRDDLLRVEKSNKATLKHVEDRASPPGAVIKFSTNYDHKK